MVIDRRDAQYACDMPSSLSKTVAKTPDPKTDYWCACGINERFSY